MINFLLQSASDLFGEGLSNPDVAVPSRQKLKIQDGHEFDHLQEGFYEKSGTGHPTGHLQEWADHPNSKTKTKRKNQNEVQERNELKTKTEKNEMQEGHEFDHLQEGHYEKSGTGHPTGHLQEWAYHPNSKTKTKRKNQNEMQERKELKTKKEKNEMQEGHEFDHLQEGHYENQGLAIPLVTCRNGLTTQIAKLNLPGNQNVNQYYSDDYEEYITLHEGILLTLNTRHDPTIHKQEHIEQPVLQETQTQNQPQGKPSDDSEVYIDKCPYTMTLPKKQVQHEINLTSIKEKLNSNFENNWDQYQIFAAMT